MPDIAREDNIDTQKAIIRMVAFFDLFESPLTAYEIYRNFEGKASFSEILKSLDELLGKDEPVLSSCQGFYFLVGRSDIIKTRRERYNHFYRKLKIARRFTAIFSKLPFIEMVALANVIGPYNLRDKGDVDFLIIARPHRLWLTRFYCAGLAKILRSRPTKETKRDKICLSFYLSSNNLGLSGLRLPGADPYLDNWPGQLILLYNKHEIYQEFCQANGLIKPGHGYRENNVDRKMAIAENRRSFLDRLDRFLGKWQLKIMPKELKSAASRREGVVIDDNILKFYLRDRRREFAQKYEQKIKIIVS